MRGSKLLYFLVAIVGSWLVLPVFLLVLLTASWTSLPSLSDTPLLWIYGFWIAPLPAFIAALVGRLVVVNFKISKRIFWILLGSSISLCMALFYLIVPKAVDFGFSLDPLYVYPRFAYVVVISPKIIFEVSHSSFMGTLVFVATGATMGLILHVLFAKRSLQTTQNE